MNNWTISGRLGKDAEQRTTPSGKAVTGFSVAVDQRRGGEKQTLWVDCRLWGERGDKLAQYLTKGTVVSVAGEASAREHNGKVYMGLDVREVTLLGGNRDNAQRGGGGAPRQQDRPSMMDQQMPVTDDFGGDGIPF